MLKNNHSLKVKFIEQDTVEPLHMAYNHSLLYNQSQNNILKVNWQVSPLNPFDKLTACGDLLEHVLLKYLFVTGRYYLELKCFIDWTRTVNWRDEKITMGWGSLQVLNDVLGMMSYKEGQRRDCVSTAIQPFQPSSKQNSLKWKCHIKWHIWIHPTG